MYIKKVQDAISLQFIALKFIPGNMHNYRSEFDDEHSA